MTVKLNTKEKVIEPKKPVKEKEQTDIEYLNRNMVFVNQKLAEFRYGIKELKACIAFADGLENLARKKQLQDEKGKLLGMIKEAMKDQKRILSILKKIKSFEVKNPE